MASVHENIQGMEDAAAIVTGEVASYNSKYEIDQAARLESHLALQVAHTWKANRGIVDLCNSVRMFLLGAT